MKTYEITKEQAGDFVCEGYKAVKWDYSTNGNSNFKYGKENESLVGKFFTVDEPEKIEECKWGLHFSKDPANVFNFYDPLGYNHYYKVKAYGKVVDAKDKAKTVAKTVKFVEEYDLMQFIEIIKSYDRSGNNYSDGNNCSHGNNWSDGNNHSHGTSYCFALSQCNGAYYSAFCIEKNGIAYYLFNKKSTEKRCKEVIKKLQSFGWYPKFHNIYDLKGNKEWWTVCFPKLMEAKPKDAWANMPEEMREYVKNLPEYDEEVFKKITEAEE